MTNAHKVIDIALAEVGYLEKSAAAYKADPLIVFEKTAGAGYDNYTKYAYELDRISGWYNGKKNGYAWCNVFVDWCLIQAYGAEKAAAMINHGVYGASVGWSADYYKWMKRLYFKDPEIGDQVYFGSDYDNLTHTGLIYDVTDDYIFTVEGNTSIQDGVIPNGGGVFKKRYSRWNSYVCCFGRPRYEEEQEGGDDMNWDDVTKDMILDKLGDKWIATIDDVPNWARKDVRQLLDDGIINGGTDAETDPDDINMFFSDVKSLIAMKRELERY